MPWDQDIGLEDFVDVASYGYLNHELIFVDAGMP